MQAHHMGIGRLGETYAAHFLQSQGYEILSSNFTVRGGEIDLVAKESSDPISESPETLVFVEVKTRTSQFMGSGEEAFGFKKRRHLQRAINEYLIRNFLKKGKPEPAVRQDLIELSIGKNGEIREIFHFENV